MTAGIRHLLHRWQRTFPLNPYARITAYLPLAALFICVVSLHYVSYFELWQTQNTVRAAFPRDYALIQTELKKPEYQNQTCYVESSDAAFNRLLSAAKLQCHVNFSDTTTSYLLLREKSSLLNMDSANQVTTALTSDTTADNVRWLIVKN